MRVLFPLDGSERGYAAMEGALDLLHSGKVQATLLVVLSDFKGASEDMVQEFEADPDDEIFPTEDSAAVVLRQATQRVRRKGVQLRLKVARGDVVKEIAAESANHDLLVMHSMRPTQRFRLRSRRTKRIVRTAKCNILLMQAY